MRKAREACRSKHRFLEPARAPDEASQPVSKTGASPVPGDWHAAVRIHRAPIRLAAEASPPAVHAPAYALVCYHIERATQAMRQGARATSLLLPCWLPFSNSSNFNLRTFYA